MRYLKANIDLTDSRDFNKKGLFRVRGGFTDNRVVNNSGVRHVNLTKTNDEFIKRLYTSDCVNSLIENMEKTCDRCGKYDYFNLFKTSLCNRCDEFMDEEFKIEYFLTGDREMRNLKKSKRSNVERVWWL